MFVYYFRIQWYLREDSLGTWTPAPLPRGRPDNTLIRCRFSTGTTGPSSGLVLGTDHCALGTEVDALRTAMPKLSSIVPCPVKLSIKSVMSVHENASETNLLCYEGRAAADTHAHQIQTAKTYIKVAHAAVCKQQGRICSVMTIPVKRNLQVGVTTNSLHCQSTNRIYGICDWPSPAPLSH
mgnify:CR=1 FL=1